MSAGLIGCMTTPNQHNRIPPGATWAADNGKFGNHYVGDDAWLSWLARMVPSYGPGKCLPKVLDWLGQHAAAEQVRAAAGQSGRDRHWHPKPSSWIGADGRIHAPEGWRTHLIHGVHCDERDCQACIHDCECARCDPWCRCDRPPNPMLPGGEMRFSDDGRLTEDGLLALADELAHTLGPPWAHDRTNQVSYRTALASPDD